MKMFRVKVSRVTEYNTESANARALADQLPEGSHKDSVEVTFVPLYANPDIDAQLVIVCRGEIAKKIVDATWLNQVDVTIKNLEIS